MNWLEGNTDYYSSEYLTGMEMAYPERWKKLIGEKNSAALIRRRPAFGRPVVIISGGAANGPLFPGYVGEGLADAAVVGGAYSAPNAYAIYETGKYIDSGHGVLLLYNNFAGDYLNNDMAAELLAMDGIPVESVWTTDDIASALGEEKSARSGRTGIALMIKLAGSCLSEGYTLHQAAELLRKANERTATLSMRVDFSDRKVILRRGIFRGAGLYDRALHGHEQPCEAGNGNDLRRPQTQKGRKADAAGKPNEDDQLFGQLYDDPQSARGAKQGIQRDKDQNRQLFQYNRHIRVRYHGDENRRRDGASSPQRHSDGQLYDITESQYVSGRTSEEDNRHTG